MPSAFETQFAANLPTLYAAFGLAASYIDTNDIKTTVGLDGNPLIVRVHRNDVRSIDNPSGAAGEMQTGEIMVQQSQMAKPVRGGRFAVEGFEVWTVELTPILKNGEHICTCSRRGTDRLMERRTKDNG